MQAFSVPYINSLLGCRGGWVPVMMASGMAHFPKGNSPNTSSVSQLGTPQITTERSPSVGETTQKGGHKLSTYENQLFSLQPSWG